MTLHVADGRAVRVLGIEFSSDYDAGRVTLLIDRTDVPPLTPGTTLRV